MAESEKTLWRGAMKEWGSYTLGFGAGTIIDNGDGTAS
jgi:hypothetical protein